MHPEKTPKAMIPTIRYIMVVMMMATLAAAAGPGREQEPARGQPSNAERASKIKAGMVLNFIRYTEWPASTFASEGSPIVVSVLGQGDMIAELEQTMSGQRVHGRAVEVRRLTYPEPLPGEPTVSQDRLREYVRQALASQVVFICESERDRLATVLEQLSGSDILTVSTIDGFAERGGMLGLSIRRDRIVFDANPGKIQGTQLKVSSQLLRLARTVKSGGQ
jgi:hypothetical protein